MTRPEFRSLVKQGLRLLMGNMQGASGKLKASALFVIIYGIPRLGVEDQDLTQSLLEVGLEVVQALLVVAVARAKLHLQPDPRDQHEGLT